MQVQSQLLANSGETCASRLAWLDRLGAVIVAESFRRFGCQDTSSSHTVLPEDPVLEPHEQT